jgi:hypothetical protein
MKPMDIAVFSALGIALMFVAYLILTAHEGEGDWQKFVGANHCQAVGAADGSNRGGWRCDDGRIHYRWRQQK